MSGIKVAFQGEMGAYSHIACEKLFPGSAIKACPTFEETFRTAHEDDNYKIRNAKCSCSSYILKISCP